MPWWLLAERDPLVGHCAMKALPLEEIGMDCVSEVTVPGPLWEETPHATQDLRPCRLSLVSLCLFPPQLCPSLDGYSSMC